MTNWNALAHFDKAVVTEVKQKHYPHTLTPYSVRVWG